MPREKSKPKLALLTKRASSEAEIRRRPRSDCTCHNYTRKPVATYVIWVYTLARYNSGRFNDRADVADLIEHLLLPVIYAALPPSDGSWPRINRSAII